MLAPSSGRAEGPSKVECVAANEAGQVLVQSGKRIEAERKFATCMAASCPIPVREDCAQRLIEIDRAMPSIVFECRDSAGQAVRVAHVTMDGQPLPDALDGKPLRLDAGQHRFVFEAEGRSPIEKTFTLRDGEKSRKETIVFAAAPPTVPAALAVPAGAAAPTLAVVAGGIGLAGLALGIGAGVLASSRNAALEGECQGNVCPPTAQHDIDDFRTWRDWSTAGYVLGGLAVAGGVVLWLTAPKARASGTAAGLWIGPQGAGCSGRF